MSSKKSDDVEVVEPDIIYAAYLRGYSHGHTMGCTLPASAKLFELAAWAEGVRQRVLDMRGEGTGLMTWEAVLDRVWALVIEKDDDDDDKQPKRTGKVLGLVTDDDPDVA